MLTRLLNDIEPLSDDTLILSNLDFKEHDGPHDGRPYPIGIRNSDGVVYRLVQAQNVGETLRIVRVLQKLGFAEEDCRAPAEGCESTFRRRRKALH